MLQERLENISVQFLIEGPKMDRKDNHSRATRQQFSLSLQDPDMADEYLATAATKTITFFAER